MSVDLAALAQVATAELADVLARALPDRALAMAVPIQDARRIALYGVGREGLMMKALAMRLFHLGLDVAVVGEMTAPHIGAGDLLIVSAGPGDFSTVAGLVGEAAKAGAATMCITAQPQGAVPRACDHVIHLPAQTMADDGSAGSVLPMGSLYEGAMFLFFEIVILHLRALRDTAPDAMRAFHTNME